MYAHWEGRDAIISTCSIKLIITGGPTIEKELLNGDLIVPRTPKDLETTFELLDKPILHYIDGEEEVHAIIDDGISYEYRKPLPKEEKKDN
ncbi:hypothetical protein E3E35_00205 [Thermococcus sp. GR7]|uniref:hypothetical protein n=1 Tax=unclassified Thermococcus TaxID=2627626 RepID=UPI00143168E1|nr:MULTISPECIES: hypothetical protein [unclassified Thermococcus]NJE45853.1 hypothetical protein [Thermococcus sp. GR7]NJE79185.1 hypothetical protein [Thermococcus sp. GR4]NJF22047.1 hypothetical protein [Thermococcus sp. GR5]